jgi:hypothetical protein
MRFKGILILLPYMIGFTPEDSSYSDIQFGAGGGQYTYADCGGNHASEYVDVGFRYTHKYEAPWRIGASISTVPVNNKATFPLLYPDLAYDNGGFSFGTTGLRVGGLNETFFEMKLLDEVPFTSGKGFARIGLNTPVGNNGSRFWLGANSGIYQGWGLSAGTEWPYADNKFLFLNFRYGEKYRVPEYGISLGMRLRK